MRRSNRQRNVLPPIGDFSNLQNTKDDYEDDDEEGNDNNEIHMDIRQARSAPTSPRIPRHRELISLDSRKLRPTSPNLPQKTQTKKESKLELRKRLYQAKSDTNIRGVDDENNFGDRCIEIGTPAPGFHTSLDVNVDGVGGLDNDDGDMSFPAIKVDSCADRKASIIAESFGDTHSLSPRRISSNVNIRKVSSFSNLAKQKQPLFKSRQNNTMEPDFVSVSQIPVNLSRSENDIYGNASHDDDVSFSALAAYCESHSDYSSDETLIIPGNIHHSVNECSSKKSPRMNRKQYRDVSHQLPPVNPREVGSKIKTDGSVCKSFNVTDRSSSMSNVSSDSATSCTSPDGGMSPGTRRRVRETHIESSVHSLHTPKPPRSPSPRRRLDNKWVVQDDVSLNRSRSVSPNVCKKPIRLLPIEYEETK
ncbi:unnamed protein product [Owenia fusiformis]|uniref:Uncharacterized protein n=1 Tax=Owenia fusiformis TaxID=6347 RepID=A0A8S4Q4T8_OWEFU|nr:unnamed protein product [Owenia fusiformis]